MQPFLTRILYTMRHAMMMCDGGWYHSGELHFLNARPTLAINESFQPAQCATPNTGYVQHLTPMPKKKNRPGTVRIVSPRYAYRTGHAILARLVYKGLIHFKQRELQRVLSVKTKIVFFFHHFFFFSSHAGIEHEPYRIVSYRTPISVPGQSQN